MITTIGKITTKEEKKFFFKKTTKLIFVPRLTNNIFNCFDKMDTEIVYIKAINNKPVEKVRFGALYNIEDLEIIGEPEKLYSKNTIKTLLDLGLISHEYDEEHPVCRDWLLSELIQIKNGITAEALDAVYEDDKNLYSNRKLSALLTLAESTDALKWLFEKGAKLAIVSGYGSPIHWQLTKLQVGHSKENVEFLMNRLGCKTIEELENYPIENY